MSTNGRGLLTLGVGLLTALALYLGYALCFAFWMLEYPNSDHAHKSWETRLWIYLAGLVVAAIADVYCLIKLLKRP